MNIQAVAISRTNKDADTLDHYISYISGIIRDAPDHSIIVLPEYAWGELSNTNFDQVVSKIQKKIQKNQQIILGSYPQKIQHQVYNCAIYLNGSGTRILVPKSHVLEEEKKRAGIVGGENPGIIKYNGINIAVLICADLWDSNIMQKIVPQADILVVPAMTTVLPKHSSYAKYQWYSLLITRSREFIVPIIVADHKTGTQNYDVGGVTSIVDPSWKNPSMEHTEDFFHLPTNGLVSASIDLNKVNEYKRYRIEKGLYHY